MYLIGRKTTRGVTPRCTSTTLFSTHHQLPLVPQRQRRGLEQVQRPLAQCRNMTAGTFSCGPLFWLCIFLFLLFATVPFSRFHCLDLYLAGSSATPKDGDNDTPKGTSSWEERLLNLMGFGTRDRAADDKGKDNQNTTTTAAQATPQPALTPPTSGTEQPIASNFPSSLTTTPTPATSPEVTVTAAPATATRPDVKTINIPLTSPQILSTNGKYILLVDGLYKQGTQYSSFIAHHHPALPILTTPTATATATATPTTTTTTATPTTATTTPTTTTTTSTTGIVTKDGVKLVPFPPVTDWPWDLVVFCLFSGVLLIYSFFSVTDTKLDAISDDLRWGGEMTQLNAMHKLNAWLRFESTFRRVTE